jgi:hypothetical protein
MLFVRSHSRCPTNSQYGMNRADVPEAFVPRTRPFLGEYSDRLQQLYHFFFLLHLILPFLLILQFAGGAG